MDVAVDNSSLSNLSVSPVLVTRVSEEIERQKARLALPLQALSERWTRGG
jgi:hypothetical protein